MLVLTNLIDVTTFNMELIDVSLSDCDYTQSEIRNVLMCWQTIHSFSSKQWMTQRQCVYELFHWHNTQLICVLESHIQLNAIVTYYCERHLRVSHAFSCLFRQVYISQYKFHIISSSHFTCTACTSMYYRFFNLWNKLLKCTYIHLSLFHSNVSNIQQLKVNLII